MDPNTVIAVIAAHLLAMGGLMFLIGRDMPPRTGLERWSVGMLVFGSSFVARLVGGAEAATAWSLATDACV
ncbi:MAG: hypothetical protein KGL43_09965, partial [Burkholderiales bacterium]|nr:hypothetical protein [Burkholderiales bacterium]